MKRVLLVEGVDDEHVVKNLCGERQIGKIDEIKNCKGYTNLLIEFPVRLKASEVSDVLGIVIDADTDLASRWQSIRDKIVQAGFSSVTDSPVLSGLILDPPFNSLLPRLGVWLMPNNQLPGVLEDFIRLLVPEGDRLFPYAQTCVRGIEPDLKHFRDLDLPKVNIHTWLAWQREPGKPLGQSITSHVLDAHSPAAALFSNWLKALYFPENSLE